jgi:hypothetical protein
MNTTVGNGTGSAVYTVGVNTGTTPRTGTVTIAGQTVTVTQARGGCTYAFTPASASVAGSGATGTVAVAAPTGCAWTAAANVAWITINGVATGDGNGNVSYTVAPNPTTQTRAGYISFGTAVFWITQGPPTPPTTPKGLRVVGIQ